MPITLSLSCPSYHTKYKAYHLHVHVGCSSKSEQSRVIKRECKVLVSVPINGNGDDHINTKRLSDCKVLEGGFM